MIGSIYIKYFDRGLNGWCPHEIAHQWFGSGAFADYGKKGNSCVFEPLAEYLKLMFLNYNSVMNIFRKNYKISNPNTIQL